jgi:hypothetical protein
MKSGSITYENRPPTKLPRCRARLRCRMSDNQTNQPLIMTQR